MAGRPCEIEMQHPLPNPEDVIMRIGKTGHNRLALEINRAGLRPGIFLGRLIRADEKDELVLDRNRLRAGGGVVDGVNVSIGENDVGRPGRSAIGSRKKDEEDENEQNVSHVQLGERFSRKAAIPSRASADSRASM